MALRMPHRGTSQDGADVILDCKGRGRWKRAIGFVDHFILLVAEIKPTIDSLDLVGSKEVPLEKDEE